MKDIYLYLPSNTKHTGNTPGEFIVPLAQPYELVGEWEVGLMEIQYARTWYNVPSDQFVQVGNTTILIPEGIYADIRELIKILNKKIKWGLGGNPPLTVEFNTIETTQKTRLKIETNDASEELVPDLYLSKRLSDMLGFVMTGPFSAGDRKSKYPADIEDGIHNLYVYCDLIEPVAVGNAKVPLLKIVPIQKGPIVTTTYSKVFYYLVMRKIFGAVEINIKGDTGEIIPFVGGKSFVTLHFRKK